MRSLKEIITFAEEKKLSLPNAILAIDAEAAGVSEADIRAAIRDRMSDIERSVTEAAANKEEGKLVSATGAMLRQHSLSDNRQIGRAHV